MHTLGPSKLTYFNVQNTLGHFFFHEKYFYNIFPFPPLPESMLLLEEGEFPNQIDKFCILFKTQRKTLVKMCTWPTIFSPKLLPKVTLIVTFCCPKILYLFRVFPCLLFIPWWSEICLFGVKYLLYKLSFYILLGMPLKRYHDMPFRLFKAHTKTYTKYT